MSGQVGAWLLGAVLGCWCLGAYNRLVRLRQAVAAAFRTSAEALAVRHRQVGGWLDATRPPADGPGPLAAWQAAEAAWRQAQAAADHAVAGRRSADAALLDSLALAERGLRGALGQWAAVAEAAAAADGLPSPYGSDPAGPGAATVTATEATLEAARIGFNAAADAYNGALRQFPTRIVGWLFGFHAAGHL